VTRNAGAAKVARNDSSRAGQRGAKRSVMKRGKRKLKCKRHTNECQKDAYAAKRSVVIELRGGGA